MISNHYEESMIWNSDLSRFDGILTYTDISAIILAFYKEVITNGEYCKEKYIYLLIIIKLYILVNGDMNNFQQKIPLMEEGNKKYYYKIYINK